MSDPLEDKQYVPLSKSERAQLKEQARERGMTTATFSRALLQLGQRQLGTKSGETLIEEERLAAQERLTVGARAAADARWAAEDRASRAEVDHTHTTKKEDDVQE